MAKLKSLDDLLVHELQDIYHAEGQITKALPKMAKAAKHEELKEAFETHLEETENHIQRLEEVFEVFGQPAKTKKCKAMQGLIEEAQDLIEEEEGDAALSKSGSDRWSSRSVTPSYLRSFGTSKRNRDA